MSQNTPKADGTARTSAPNYFELLTQAGDAWLAQVSELQDNWLKATERLAANLPKSEAFPKVDAADFGVPTIREVVEANFSVMDKYLANQRSYLDRVLKISGS
jgi:hypothetical protein